MPDVLALLFCLFGLVVGLMLALWFFDDCKG